MKKVIVLICATVLVVGGTVGYFYHPQSDTQPVELTKIVVANQPVAHALPFYLAIEKGYFREVGLDVTLTPFDSANQIVDATMTGQVQCASIAAFGPLIVADFKNPGKFKVLMIAGGDTVNPNDTLLVRADSPIYTIKDLKGKKVGIFPGLQTNTVARYILEKEGLTVGADAELVELAPALQVQALATGQVDALYTVEPITTVAKQKSGARELVHALTAEYITDPFYAGASLVNADFLAKDPETVRKVLAVLERAIKEIERDPGVAKQYLVGYTSIDSTLAPSVPSYRFKTVEDITTADIASVQTFLDIFTKHKIIDRRADFTGLLYKK